MFTEICQRAMQQQAELIGANITRLSQQLKRFSSVKKPEEFITLQKECFNENIAASVEYFQQLFSLSMHSVEEVTKQCANAGRDAMQGNANKSSSDKSKL